MAENDDVAGSPDRDVTPPEHPVTDEPTTVSQPVAAGATTATPAPRTRWRDRAWSFQAMVAVALATLVMGGVVGLVLGGFIGAVATHHHDRNDRFDGRFGPGMGPGWRMHQGPGRRWQQQPPPQLTPYGAPGGSGPTPSTPSPSASGSAG